MISESYKKKIIDLLNSDLVRNDDFILNEKEGSGYSLIIIYRYDPEIMFSIEIGYNGEPQTVTFAPGNVLSLETKRINNDNRVEDFIKKWVRNINLKMAALPVMRKMSEQEESLNEIENMMKGYYDESVFKSSEIEELKTKLNKLQEKFEEKIKRDYELESNKETIISEMKDDINRLKAEANILTKKNWLLSFYTKFHLLAQKHPKLTALLGGIAYESLPESIKDNIPEDSVNMFLQTESIETSEK